MSKPFRISLVSFILLLGVYQALFVFQPVAIPKPSESLLWWGISSTVATAFWLVVFVPAWLPVTVPSTLPRLSAALLAVCGAVLVGLGCLLALYGAVLPLPNHFLAFGLLAMWLGGYYIYKLVRGARVTFPVEQASSQSQDAA